MFINRLSGKLLIMTIVFVMLAEVLIFIPSAAMFRHSWLEERAEAAGLLTLAIEGVPDYMGGEMLSKQFMKDTGCSMVVQKRTSASGEILRQTVLGSKPNTKHIITEDLRIKRRLPLFRDSFRDFFGAGEGTIRILSEPTVQGVDVLEVFVPQSALQMALRDYCRRVLLWSLAISLLTGIMIYLALSRMIARPIKRLAKGLADFRNAPRQRPGLQEAKMTSLRKDEIGQLEREFVAMKEGVRGAFKQQERLATLGMAMAKINHDLRNVLTSTQLISDRLADDPDPRISTMGKRLVKTVDRGVKLCEATLGFSQSVEDRPKPQAIRLATLVGEAAADSMVENGARQHKIKFINDINTTLKVKADPTHSYRIFHNLLRNAVQAMQTEYPNNIVPVLQVEASEKDGKVSVRIIDTGPGLPQKAQDNLFKAFTSAGREGGTGLGLTIARELARSQGGNLRLESTNEDGTVFVVELPST